MYLHCHIDIPTYTWKKQRPVSMNHIFIENVWLASYKYEINTKERNRQQKQ